MTVGEIVINAPVAKEYKTKSEIGHAEKLTFPTGTKTKEDKLPGCVNVDVVAPSPVILPMLVSAEIQMPLSPTLTGYLIYSDPITGIVTCGKVKSDASSKFTVTIGMLLPVVGCDIAATEQGKNLPSSCFAVSTRLSIKLVKL